MCHLYAYPSSCVLWPVCFGWVFFVCYFVAWIWIFGIRFSVQATRTFFGSIFSCIHRCRQRPMSAWLDGESVISCFDGESVANSEPTKNFDSHCVRTLIIYMSHSCQSQSHEHCSAFAFGTVQNMRKTKLIGKYLNIVDCLSDHIYRQSIQIDWSESTNITLDVIFKHTHSHPWELIS